MLSETRALESEGMDRHSGGQAKERKLMMVSAKQKKKARLRKAAQIISKKN